MPAPFWHLYALFWCYLEQIVPNLASKLRKKNAGTAPSSGDLMHILVWIIFPTKYIKIGLMNKCEKASFVVSTIIK